MRVLETIPTLDLKRLADLEENARRWAVSGTETQKVDAECVLPVGTKGSLGLSYRQPTVRDWMRLPLRQHEYLPLR